MGNAAPNASKHYLMAGIKANSLTKYQYALPLFGIRMSPGSFDDGNNIDSETDEGHTGVSNVDMGSFRKSAESAPTWEDKLRYGEGLEDMIYMFLPNHEVTAYNNGTADVDGVYKHTFDLPVNYNNDLPLMTVYNGFNETLYDARAYGNAMLNSIEFTFANDNAPTMKPTLLSDYNNFNLRNPDRTYLADHKRRFVQTNHVSIFIGDVGATAQQMLANPIDCFLQSSLTINNNIESIPCHSDPLGVNTKTMGKREGTGSIQMPWKYVDDESNNTFTGTRYFETEFEGFNKYGHEISEEIPNKQIWYRCQGGNIHRFSTTDTLLTGETLVGSTTVNSTTTYEIATGIPYTTFFKIPEVEITKVTSPKSGTDAKDLTMEYKIVEQPTVPYMNVEIISDLSALHIDSTGTTRASLEPNIAPFPTSA